MTSTHLTNLQLGTVSEHWYGGWGFQFTLAAVVALVNRRTFLLDPCSRML